MPTLNGIYYMAVPALKAAGLSESTIMNSLSQNRKRNGLGAWQHIRPAEVDGTGEHDRRVIWVRVDSIPASLRDKHNLPSQEPRPTAVQTADNKQPAPLASTVKTPDILDADRKFFETHARPDGSRTYTFEQAVALAQAAAWLRMCALPAAQRPTIEAIHTAIVQEPPLGLRASTGDALSLKRLFSKVAEWKQKGCACLVSGKLGNSNSRKITDEVAAILAKYAAMPTALDSVQVWDFYNHIDRNANPNLPALSHSAVKNYLQQPEIQRLVSKSRSGSHTARNKYEPLIHRKLPTLAHRLWVIDGTPLDLYYSDGKSTWKRAYFFFAVDAASRHIVGAAIGTVENQAIVRDTILAAIRYTGFLPDQIMADNGSAITATDTRAWLRSICTTTFTEAGNARAKIAENTWSQFLHKYLNRYPNYAGGNVTSKSLANREFLTTNKHLIPSLDELKMQLRIALDEYNSHHPLPNQTEARPVTQDILRDVAWQWRVKPGKRTDTNVLKQAYTYSNAGIGFDLDTVNYKFEVRDAAGQIDMNFFQNWAYKEFHVKYDPSNLDRIALFTEDDRFVTYAINTDFYAQAMALKDQQPGDAARRIEDLERRKAWRNSQAFLDPGMAAALYTLRPTIAGKAKDMTNLAEDVLKTLDLPDYTASEPHQHNNSDSLYDDFIDPKYLVNHE